MVVIDNMVNRGERRYKEKRKMKFRKILAVLGSAVLVGSSMGFAAAANYPAPFNEGKVAVVYGSNAAGSDIAQAANIFAGLNKLSTSTSATTSASVSGEAYVLQKTSTKFHLGDYVGDVVSTKITDDDLPTLLADGTYVDDDNDEFDYSQEINLYNSSLRLEMFEDNDYKPDEPTVGIKIDNGDGILNYTLDFSDEPYWSDLATTDFPLLGKEYYVLSTSNNNSMTLLDSAADAIVVQDESQTITVNGNSYEVSIEFIGSSDVKLNVNGEVTNSLSEGETYKLSDGSYVGVKDIMYTSKDGESSKVEISIGSGKLVLTNGQDVELNEDTISGLVAYLGNNGGKLSNVTLSWEADDDLFITEDSSITLPGFGSIKMSFGGMVYPAQESIKIEAGGDDYAQLKDFPLKDTTSSINFLYFNGSAYTAVGKDASENLLRTSGTNSITFYGDTDSYFIASWTDGNDAESYLMRATDFKNDSGTIRCDIQYMKDGSWVTKKDGAENGDTVSLGNVDLNIGAINKADKTVVIAAGNNNVDFHTLYSAEGMKVYLPWVNTTDVTVADNSSTCNSVYGTLGVGQLGYDATLTLQNGTQFNCTYYPSTYSLIFSEEDKDGNIGDGANITVTLGDDSNDEVSVTGVSPSVGGSSTEIDDSDVYRNFAYSDLATEIKWDKGPDQQKAELIYHGDESYGLVYIGAEDASVAGGSSSSSTATSTVDVELIKDSEVSSYSDRNLIVVGGSCVNSVAANLLGGSFCGEEFTSKTGVGVGQYLIQSFGDAYTEGKIALLVAGYEAGDTVNAVKYLLNNNVDTSAGKKYIGSTATSAQAVVTSA